MINDTKFLSGLRPRPKVTRHRSEASLLSSQHPTADSGGHCLRDQARG